MPLEFFGKEIQVVIADNIRTPKSFKLAGKEYFISEILQEWQDHGFGLTATGRRTRWWQRRHRNYYIVKTSEGEVFEIYYDRGTNLNHPERKKWILHSRL
jgi:hypothetical protein